MTYCYRGWPSNVSPLWTVEDTQQPSYDTTTMPMYTGGYTLLMTSRFSGKADTHDTHTSTTQKQDTHAHARPQWGDYWCSGSLALGPITYLSPPPYTLTSRVTTTVGRLSCTKCLSPYSYKQLVYAANVSRLCYVLSRPSVAGCHHAILITLVWLTSGGLGLGFRVYLKLVTGMWTVYKDINIYLGITLPIYIYISIYPLCWYNSC